MIPNHKLRVLAVGDDAGLGRFLSPYLVRRGFDVSNALTGEEALRMFRVYDPALVLLDLATPGMGAFDLREWSQ